MVQVGAAIDQADKTAATPLLFAADNAECRNLHDWIASSPMLILKIAYDRNSCSNMASIGFHAVMSFNKTNSKLACHAGGKRICASKQLETLVPPWVKGSYLYGGDV